MDKKSDSKISENLLALVPLDGSPIGNGTLQRELAGKLGRDIDDYEYARHRDDLIAQGLLAKGKGRGGSVRHSKPSAAAFDLQAQQVRDAADVGAPRARSKPAGKRKSPVSEDPQVICYRHADKRRNNPEVGMVDPDSDPDGAKRRYAYDPHLDPQLMWTGKTERTSFEIDTVSLHVHERIDPATILGAVQKRIKQGKAGDGQQDWLRAWFETPLPYRDAIEFYKHDRGWANRLITGDSLLVMNSLLQKEGMAGQVQMIYIDPPYGIKYGSNFQPFVNKRDVKDRKDEDLTQEPEMIKAFRDTWELGVHSYLTYLRDRLLLAKALLSDSGSVFVQISDENLHHVREICDEVFSPGSYVSLIAFTKTTGLASDGLADRCDYIVWYAKNKQALKFRPCFQIKEPGQDGAQQYEWAEFSSGVRKKVDQVGRLSNVRVFNHDNLTSFLTTPHLALPIEFRGEQFSPASTTQWKTTREGLVRLSATGRLMALGRTLRYVRMLEDFPVVPFTSLWTDTGISGFSDPKIYAVQTSSKVIERCLMMTTDPGDLVLDPTCGSGTTAVAAERWGRRWITCDTSRVAVTLAKQRIMTSSFDYYDLRYPHEGLKSGFIYRTVPHVTLKSIANNPEIDEIYGRLHTTIESALTELNIAFKQSPPADEFEVTEGGRKGEALALGKPGTYTLPTGEKVPAGSLLEWEVPFDFPDSWPAAARAPFDAVHKARQTMQARMDASIAAHADTEILYDQPEVSKSKRRVSGPFTVEAVPSPMVLSLDETETPQEADVAIARSGESSRHHQWRDELARTGIRGKGGQILKLADLETLPEVRYLHCSGAAAETGERVVVSFGPEHAALEQRQVELAIREAGDLFPRPKIIVFCAFAFDPEAAKDIDATKGITALKAQMNTDLLTEDLKKARANNQSFWLMGQPEVELHTLKDGRYQIEVHGFDYFDTVKGELVSGGKGKIAAWALDTNYDERSLFPRQVFFPMAGAKDGWNKLRRDIKAELDESLLGKLHGTKSLPFEAGDNRKVAVKIVDDRGIESLKIIRLS